MGIFMNSVDPDEMLHYTAFHLGLLCKGNTHRYVQWTIPSLLHQTQRFKLFNP